MPAAFNRRNFIKTSALTGAALTLNNSIKASVRHTHATCHGVETVNLPIRTSSVLRDYSNCCQQLSDLSNTCNWREPIRQ